MKGKTILLLAGGIPLMITAGLLAMPLLHFQPQPATYTTSNPAAQAELERLLKKHGVPFTYASDAPTITRPESAVVTVTQPGSVVIEDAGAPNAVAAIMEFAKWSASHP
jgi:hypothetical protein